MRASRLAIPRAARCDWETPPVLFAQWDAEFRFTLDAAASPENAKCPRYFTEADHGLTRSWAGERVWCNPPYGHDRLWRWVAKAHAERLHAPLVVMLVPAYTATKWWHTYTPDAEVRFLKGKIQFVGAKDRAGFASALLIYSAAGGR